MPQLKATLEEVVRGIDWAELRAQKAHLIEVRGAVAVANRAPQYNWLGGVIHLIDSIQDAAVTECIATEEEVFDLPRGS